MGKIDRSEFNVYDIPAGATVRSNGYVYVNTSSYWVRAKDNKPGYPSHDKRCIGVLKEGGKMYANNNYFKLFDPENLPDLPDKCDHVKVGLHALSVRICEEYDLRRLLEDVFTPEETDLILDLALYMLGSESAVFQHFPAWAKEHSIHSATIRSDAYISEFLGEKLTVSRINSFRDKWAKKNIGSGRVYFCYDSTNINSQANGVTLVQKGHAKDDPTLEQVNMDYVVRQDDGIPLTFTAFPGSINDMVEAPQIIQFIKKIKDDSENKVTAVCDRGYISQENVSLMDDAGVDFLLMLKEGSKKDEILTEFGDMVKNRYSCYLKDHDVFGKTEKKNLFEGEDSSRCFHIIWDAVLDGKNRRTFLNAVDVKRSSIERDILRGTKHTEDEIRHLSRWFDLVCQEEGELEVKARGRSRSQTKSVPGYVITSCKDNEEAINHDMNNCGFYVLVSSEEMSIQDAVEAYKKRDCVEKVFRALKSSLGMEKIGVHDDDNIFGKTLIWFVAAIYHSVLFKYLKPLQEKDRKNYTVPAAIDHLESIGADKDLHTGKYERRYAFTKRQKDVLSKCGILTSVIEELISGLR